MAKKIHRQSTALLNFSLALADGEKIDDNFDQPPLKYVLGSGDMLPDFERQLLGMGAGEEKQVMIEAANAFGEYREENVQRFKKSHFEPTMELSQGLIVSFADAAGGEVPGVVCAIDPEADSVEVDFNHPLAGKNIDFRVSISEILDET